MTTNRLIKRVHFSLLLRTATRAFPATVLVLILFCSAVAIRRERLIDSWKPLNYNVSLSLNERLTEVTSAKAEITIQSLKDTLSQVDLDFGEMPIDSVTVNNKAAPYEWSNGLLKIKLPNTVRRGTNFVVVISY